MIIPRYRNASLVGVWRVWGWVYSDKYEVFCTWSKEEMGVRMLISLTQKFVS